MLLNTQQKKIFYGISYWAIALSFFGLLDILNVSLDYKIFNLLQVKVLYGIILGLAGYRTLFKGESI